MWSPRGVTNQIPWQAKRPAEVQVLNWKDFGFWGQTIDSVNTVKIAFYTKIKPNKLAL